MDKTINNTTDNLYSVKINPAVNEVISNSSVETELKDENFSDLVVKPFSTLYENEIFLSEKKIFEINFLDALRNHELEDFYYSFADKTFDNYYKKYNIAAVEWLNHILLKNLDNPTIVCGVLKVLSNIEYSKLQTFAFTMLLVVIFNNSGKEDVEITDLVINCIENWEETAFIDMLSKIKSKANFIELYRNKVLKALAA